MMRRWLATAWVAVVVTLPAGEAGAHEMSMAEMQVREVAPGDFVWQWGASERRAPAEVLRVTWPETCRIEEAALRCGPDGLKGTISVEGVGNHYSAAMIKVHWLDGRARVYTLTASQPRAQLYGAAEDGRGMGEIASAYGVLGFEHILAGFDHLLFVASLLLLVGFRRQLVWTITAFTAAHSLTLGCAALGWLTLRSAPVEACIALSIVLVAGEALSKRETWTRRWPILVAFLFGLVHGLGFAGALKEIGLPENHLLVALLTFNVGVEAGQLFAVGCAYVIWRLAAGMPGLARARVALLYGMGSVAAYWSFLRITALAG